MKISVLSLCLCKIDEFVQKEHLIPVQVAKTLDFLANVGEESGFIKDESSTLDKIMSLRSSEPFINLSLKEERFVYKTYIRCILIV